MILYINGCSWSCQSTHEMETPVYGDFLAKKLGATLINHSLPGACNERIFRSSVRNLQILRETEKDIICVINITQITRSELWLDPDRRSELESIVMSQMTPTQLKIVQRYIDSNDGDYHSYLYGEDTVHRNIPGFNGLEKYTVLFDHYEKSYYNLLYQLLMFTSYCKLNGIKYLLFAGTNMIRYDILDKNLRWLTSFSKDLDNDPAILKFEEINFCQWAYYNGYRNYESIIDPVNPWTGHPDERAHAAWADFLYNKLNELYEI